MKKTRKVIDKNVHYEYESGGCKVVDENGEIVQFSYLSEAKKNRELWESGCPLEIIKVTRRC